MRPSALGAEAIEYWRTAEYPSAAVTRMSPCRPATCLGQPGTSSTIVRAVGVSSRSATTVPTRQITRPFAPPVSVVVVTTRLSEPGLVVIEQRDAAHPLGAFPEV